PWHRHGGLRGHGEGYRGGNRQTAGADAWIPVVPAPGGYGPGILCGVHRAASGGGGLTGVGFAVHAAVEARGGAVRSSGCAASVRAKGRVPSDGGAGRVPGGGRRGRTVAAAWIDDSGGIERP